MQEAQLIMLGSLSTLQILDFAGTLGVPLAPWQAFNQHIREVMPIDVVAAVGEIYERRPADYKEYNLNDLTAHKAQHVRDLSPGHDLSFDKPDGGICNRDGEKTWGNLVPSGFADRSDCI